jgi:hypothetical protein
MYVKITDHACNILYLIIKELRYLPKILSNKFLNRFALPQNRIVHRMPQYRFV